MKHPLARLLYKRVELCLYDFLFPGEIPSRPARIEVEHKVLDLAHPGRELIFEVQGSILPSERYARGEKCYLALHRGRPVSYIWGAVGPVGLDEISMAVQPGPGEVYLYDAFTLEGWRGRNLYPSVLRRALEDGREEGLTRMTIFVEAGNMASRRGVFKAGFTQFQTLIFRRVLFFGRPRLLPPLKGHPPAAFVRRP
ncbi:MAG: GNAT family N-acetyltransferase [Nitrospinota bacterium]